MNRQINIVNQQIQQDVKEKQRRAETEASEVMIDHHDDEQILALIQKHQDRTAQPPEKNGDIPLDYSMHCHRIQEIEDQLSELKANLDQEVRQVKYFELKLPEATPGHRLSAKEKNYFVNCMQEIAKIDKMFQKRQK